MDNTDLRFQPDDAHGGTALNPAPPTREAIARRAYEISVSPEGSTPDSNWRRAEAELRNQQSPVP
jgi:hypothetical protein